MRLLLAVETIARQRGHHFTIIKVGAREMEKIAWTLLEAAYYVRLRRKLGRDVRGKSIDVRYRFDRAKVSPAPSFAHCDKDGKVMEYVVGWSLVPSYMVALRQYMHPVSALDGAFCKFPAQGTFTVEVTVDGLFRLHPVCLQHTVSAECSWSYCTHFRSTKAAYHEGHINAPRMSVNGDGARALYSELQANRNEVAYSACMRHWLQHKSKGTADVARQLMHIPPIHREMVCLSYPILSSPSKSPC